MFSLPIFIILPFIDSSLSTSFYVLRKDLRFTDHSLPSTMRHELFNYRNNEGRLGTWGWPAKVFNRNLISSHNNLTRQRRWEIYCIGHSLLSLSLTHIIHSVKCNWNSRRDEVNCNYNLIWRRRKMQTNGSGERGDDDNRQKMR